MNHNKKRNTAFLFEVLIKEQTKCVLRKEIKKGKFIEKMIKSFFSKDGILIKELELYNCLVEAKECSLEYAEKLLSYVKKERDSLDELKIFESQGKLISLINKTLGPDVFTNFVPDYKNLATINMFFNKNTPFLIKMKMEEVLKESMTKKDKKIELIKEEVNLFHFRKFIENFNEKYSSLLEEQKELLNKFLLFKFGDQIDFKLHLNTECSRLVKIIESKKENVKNDQILYENINKCLTNLKLSEHKYTDDLFVYSIMKYQELARELENAK